MPKTPLRRVGDYVFEPFSDEPKFPHHLPAALRLKACPQPGGAELSRQLNSAVANPPLTPAPRTVSSARGEAIPS
jgi:hypothetical protein